MVGTWKLNAWMGAIAFVITFFSVWLSNTWEVALGRSIIAFVVFFLLVFPLRLLLFFATQPSAGTQEGQDQAGQHIDLTAGEGEEDTGETVSTAEKGSVDEFNRLELPRIERTDKQHDPLEIANVIKRLTDE